MVLCSKKELSTDLVVVVGNSIHHREKQIMCTCTYYNGTLYYLILKCSTTMNCNNDFRSASGSRTLVSLLCRLLRDTMSRTFIFSGGRQVEGHWPHCSSGIQCHGQFIIFRWASGLKDIGLTAAVGYNVTDIYIFRWASGWRTLASLQQWDTMSRTFIFSGRRQVEGHWPHCSSGIQCHGHLYFQVGVRLKDIGLTAAVGYNVTDIFANRIVGIRYPDDWLNVTVNPSGVHFGAAFYGPMYRFP